MSGSLRLVYGYVRAGDGPPKRMPVQRDALRELARTRGLLLDTVFIDCRVRPGTDRPAFRTLLDVVRALRPYGVLVPSAWHVSPWPVKRAALLGQFRSLGCSVLAAHRGKAAVLVTGQGGTRWPLVNHVEVTPTAARQGLLIDSSDDVPLIR